MVENNKIKLYSEGVHSIVKIKIKIKFFLHHFLSFSFPSTHIFTFPLSSGRGGGLGVRSKWWNKYFYLWRIFDWMLLIYDGLKTKKKQNPKKDQNTFPAAELVSSFYWVRNRQTLRRLFSTKPSLILQIVISLD